MHLAAQLCLVLDSRLLFVASCSPTATTKHLEFDTFDIQSQSRRLNSLGAKLTAKNKKKLKI